MDMPGFENRCDVCVLCCMLMKMLILMKNNVLEYCAVSEAHVR